MGGGTCTRVHASTWEGGIPLQPDLVGWRPASSLCRCTNLLRLALYLSGARLCAALLQELTSAELARTGLMSETAAAGAEALAL